MQIDRLCRSLTINRSTPGVNDPLAYQAERFSRRAFSGRAAQKKSRVTGC